MWTDMKKYYGKIMRWTLVGLTIGVLVIVCIMPARKVMAAHSIVAGNQGVNNVSNPATISVNPGSACTAVILFVHWETANSMAGETAPTIDGDTATRIYSEMLGYGTGCSAWYVAKAFDGSQIDCSVPNSGIESLSLEVIAIYAGAGYTSELNDENGYYNTGSNDGSGNIPVTSSAVGDFLIGTAAVKESNPIYIDEISTDPTKTKRSEEDMGATSWQTWYADSDGSGTENFSFTWSSSTAACIVACFKPVASGAPSAKGQVIIVNMD
jgi:hypothetical protein